MKLINNPLFKISGVIIIIYFSLFRNNDNAKSLSKRVSISKIKENIFYIKNKADFIKENLNKSNGFDKKAKNNNEPYQDLIIGVGNIKTQCGDLISIDFKKSGNNQNFSKDDYSIEIKNNDFTKNLVGMKIGGKRVINIQQEMNGKIHDFKYETSLVKILNKNIDNNDKCN